MRKTTTIRNTAPVLVATALLGLSLGGAPAAAGEGSAWQIAAQGDSVEGAGVSVLDQKGTALAIDDVGNVLFSSSLDLRDPGRTGYFVGDGGTPRLLVHFGDALPTGAGVDATGRVLESVFYPFLNLSGRTGFVGSARPASNEHVVITSDGARALRTVVVAGQALPGVGAFLAQGSHRVGLVHGDYAFMPGSIQDLGSLLIARRGTDNAVIIARSDLDVPLRNDVKFGTLTPRAAFADGSLVFTGGGGLFTWKPGVGVHTLAIQGESAPGTSETYGTFQSLFSSVRIVDGPRTDFVEAVWGARLSNRDWTVYSTRENSGSAPVVRTGVKDGAYELVAGQQSPWGFEVIPGPLGQLVFIGATTGPEMGTSQGIGKGIGVWRYDPSAPQTPKLIAHVGMTFTDGENTYIVDLIRSVAVNSAGRVAMEVDSSPNGSSVGEALLIEDATGTFVCAIRSGDRVPVREDGQDLGTGRVIGIGRNGQQQFPDVTGTGLGGQPSRFNAAGQFVTDLSGFNASDVVALGPYVFSLEKNSGGGGGGGGGEPVGLSVKAKFRRGVLKLGNGKGGGDYDVAVENGAVVVTGKNGTLVNGAGDAFRAEGATKIIAKLGKRGGTVNITGADDVPNPPSVKIVGGPADDTVTIVGSAVAGVSINLGTGGEDAVTVRDSTVNGNLKLSAAKGTSTHQIENVEVGGRVAIRLGDAQEATLAVADCVFDGALSVVSGAAGAAISIVGTEASDVRLNAARTRPGARCSVSLIDSILSGAFIERAGRGDHAVVITDSSVMGPTKRKATRASSDSWTATDSRLEGPVTSRSGRGDDVFSMIRSALMARVEVRMGAGKDELELEYPEVEEPFDVARHRFALEGDDDSLRLKVSYYVLLALTADGPLEIDPGSGTNTATLEFADTVELTGEQEIRSVVADLQFVIAPAKR